jgi:hypothetical protein
VIGPFLLATAAAAGGSGGDSAHLVCRLALPDGSRFRLEARFDESGLRSNLSSLIKAKGVFKPVDPGLVITSDGTRSHRWSLAGGRHHFDTSLTRYGQAAVLLLERRTFVGRHWGRSLVGVGLCDVDDRQVAGKKS